MRLFTSPTPRQAWVTVCWLCIVLGCLQMAIVSREYSKPAISLEAEEIDGPIEQVKQLYTKDIELNINATETILKWLTEAPAAEPLRPNNNVAVGAFVMNFSIDDSLEYGHFRRNKGFLTIALATVKREKTSYLRETIDSLLKNSSPADKETVTIVVMFSDDDQNWNKEKALNLSKEYEEHVNSGHMQILVMPEQNYPNFKTFPRTYNDSLERLIWRSKQNIHYAYLFRYCYNISEYYLHLEDDVIAAKNYTSDIQKFYRIRQNDWFFIRFSNMGFIGIFLRSADLLLVSEFFLLFYAVQPCDFLLPIVANTKLQKNEIRRRPSLFQHHGIISSLKNKRQPIVDRSFKGERIIRRKKYYNINPEAEIATTMVIYQNYGVYNPYSVEEGYFWAVSPKKGQVYTVIFFKPQNLTSIIISGGYPTKKGDYINKGLVKVSKSEHCSEWTTLGKLSKGSYNTSSYKDKETLPKLLKQLTCLEIEVLESQENWAIISEIALIK